MKTPILSGDPMSFDAATKVKSELRIREGDGESEDSLGREPGSRPGRGRRRTQRRSGLPTGGTARRVGLKTRRYGSGSRARFYSGGQAECSSPRFTSRNP